MTFLPIVDRELRVAARHKSTYWTRFWAVLLALLIFAWQMLGFARHGVTAAQHGAMLFHTLSVFAFLYCLLIGARATADCLSEEKREGTLGLLFLTDLKGYDVVLGKLVASSLNSFYGMLAILPVLALPLLMGGVTAAQFWLTMLALLNTLFFSLAAGLFVSTVSRHERKAMFGTALLLVVATAAPFLISFWIAEKILRDPSPQPVWPIIALSPGFGFSVARFGAPPFVPAWCFWYSLVLVHLLSWACLARAGSILPGTWQDRTPRPWLARWQERWQQWSYGSAECRKLFRSRLLEINPFLWLAARDPWNPKYVWCLLASIGIMWFWGYVHDNAIMVSQPILVVIALLCHTLLKIWVLSESIGRLIEDRRSGALELVLSTPLDVADILRGQWLALKRQFAGPIAVVIIFELMLLFLGLRPTIPRGEFNVWLVTVFVGIGMFLADMITLFWVGMWLGLTARNMNRALLGAAGMVLILPWVIYLGSILMWEPNTRRVAFNSGQIERRLILQILWWFALGMVNDLVWGLYWARGNLKRDFRAAAGQRTQSKTMKRSWRNWMHDS